MGGVGGDTLSTVALPVLAARSDPLLVILSHAASVHISPSSQSNRKYWYDLRPLGPSALPVLPPCVPPWPPPRPLPPPGARRPRGGRCRSGRPPDGAGRSQRSGRCSGGRRVCPSACLPGRTAPRPALSPPSGRPLCDIDTSLHY